MHSSATKVYRQRLSRIGAVNLGRSLLVVALLVLGTQAAQAAVFCEGTTCTCLKNQDNNDIATLYTDGAPFFQPGSAPDLKVTWECKVPTNKSYFFKSVNILAGGKLLFYEGDQDGTTTHFWASSIIIENGGALYAYGRDKQGDEKFGQAFGYRGGVLTIHLYGKNEAEGDPNKQNQGALCKTVSPQPEGPCGIPKDIWDSRIGNGARKWDLPGLNARGQPVNDYFYQYGPLHGDGKCTDGSVFVAANAAKRGNGCNTSEGQVGYFGNKVLAVSYGGALYLTGHKGATYHVGVDCRSDADCNPLNSGSSWMRLADGQSLGVGKDSLVLERDPGTWRAGDEIVVTTTDYLPGHSEKLKITNITRNADGTATVNFEAVETETNKTKKNQWQHNGVRYGGPKDDASKRWTQRLESRLKNSLDSVLVQNGAETRAAVALLSRSIRIVSAGDEVGQDFPPEATGYSYGAHMVIRQGFKAVQIKGVEFVQMGQGGRLGHYPVHFHIARQTPAATFVKDSSINESMTRWIVLHSTLGVTVQRNVGYKSIGHGFFLEDGTETDNQFYSNIGIFARAAVDNIQNPRKVPGILAANQERGDVQPFPFLTDSTYPSVFWITNGWNDFIGNMAAGAGACGAAFWFVPAQNSDMPEVMTANNVQDGTHMKWSGYAALQNNLNFRGTTPLKSFSWNYATSTMMSFQTTGDVSRCHGVVKANDARTQNVLKVVKSIAPEPEGNELADHYYPHARGGNRHATRCPLRRDGTYNCTGAVVKDCNPGHEESCTVTVLDHFTSAFHWAEYNIAAIWLRNQWYLMTNSVLSDVQNGGLTFVTGGDYTHSSVIKGYWGLVRNSVFIGRTQQSNGFSSDAGPFNTTSGLTCDWQKQEPAVPTPYCLSGDEGISMPLTPNFGLGQQLFHVYDGPAYQESNAYLDITTTPCPSKSCMYNFGNLAGVPKKTDGSGSCYLPNAAIGWKQPNGFFYPPAFHSTNLFFSNVDIRHYVVNPLFQAPQGVTDKEDFGQGGTYLTATSGPNDVRSAYCTTTLDMFNDFTGIDRQTVLNDDDGSLTGLSNTISINEDAFFRARVETAECKGNLGVSPSLACSTAKPPTPSTAKTSPYDYIITAVAPGCSQNKLPGKDYGRCGDDPDHGQGGTPWSSRCSTPACYGVPLYRQLLTVDEQTQWNTSDCTNNIGAAKCRWPFIRMAGQNMYQRHTLTLNGGTYYLDTSVPLDTQQKEPFTKRTSSDRDVNVFEGGQTYYIFFLYAKPSTKQTYQIYVGDRFEEGTVKAVRGNLAAAPIIFSDGTNSPKWLTVSPPKDKVLTVTIDFSAYQDELNPANKDNGLCGPKKFCKWGTGNDAGRCVSNLSDSDPQLSDGHNLNVRLKAEVDAACRNWGAKDLDCPAKGCFGFSFTLDKDFKTGDGLGQAARPTPKTFPPWTTQFVRTTTAPDNSTKPDNGVESECYYPKLPPKCLAAGRP
jgi:hypothetical protein